MIIPEEGEESRWRDKVQRIIDGLGAVQGVRYAYWVTDLGTPLIVARTTPLTEDITCEVAELVAGLLSISVGVCSCLDLGKTFDFLHLQPPFGLGILSPFDKTILVLITEPTVKLGLMHYLVTSTKVKLSKVQGY